MTENYNYLFQYLEKEGIFIDKNEFLFQIQPDRSDMRNDSAKILSVPAPVLIKNGFSFF
ncbi:hypothetical protein D3C85_1031890 [compost metagenome]